MKYKFIVPLTVRCIREFVSGQYPDTNFGKEGKTYRVQCVVPNGCYYILRHMMVADYTNDTGLLGESGEANHLLNMDRFEVVEWMTDRGIVKGEMK